MRCRRAAATIGVSASHEEDRVMPSGRSFAFPVSVEHVDGRLVRARVEGKPPLGVATPPEFKGTHPEVWSPEDLLVGATASCYAVTLVAVAERSGVPLHGLTVDGVGRMGFAEGKLAFLGIDLKVGFATDAALVEEAEKAALRAEQGCFVSVALSVPVEVELRIEALEPAAT
jgi:organic hydroperoxide reductase OsmC/OhrA